MGLDGEPWEERGRTMGKDRNARASRIAQGMVQRHYVRSSVRIPRSYLGIFRTHLLVGTRSPPPSTLGRDRHPGRYREGKEGKRFQRLGSDLGRAGTLARATTVVDIHSIPPDWNRRDATAPVLGHGSQPKEYTKMPRTSRGPGLFRSEVKQSDERRDSSPRSGVLG